MKYLLSLLFGILCALPLWSQVSPSRFYDSSWVWERKLDTLALQEAAKEKAFQYDRQQIEGPGLMERFSAWILEKLFGKYSPDDVDLFNNMLLILGILIGLSILIFYLSKISRSRLIAARGQAIQHVQFLDFEGSSSDLEQQWSNAEAAKDYSLALRYLFIKTLFFLKEKNSIVWKKEKTNSDYLRELSERWQRGPFQELSELFAYTQYGGYPIIEADYLAAKSLYERLIRGEKGEKPDG